MPIRVQVGNGALLEFPEGTSDEIISSTIRREFPPTGEDIYNRASSDPAYVLNEMTQDDYESLRRHKASKPTDHLGMLATAGGAVLSSAGDVVKGLFTKPLETVGSVPFAFAAGTGDLVNLIGDIAHIEAPDTYEKFRGNRADSSAVRAQWQSEIGKDFESFKRGAQWLVDRKDIIEAAPNPEAAEGQSMVLDPSILIPGVGEAALATKLGAKASSIGARAVGKGAQLVQRAGQAVNAAAHIPENAIARATLAATDNAAAAQKAADIVGKGAVLGLGAELGGLALPIPGVGMAARGIAGGKAIGQTLDTLGEAGAKAAGFAAEGPSRLSALELLAADKTASNGARAVGRVGAMLGADTALDFAGSAARGAAEGALVGGGLGALAHGFDSDEMWAGIGSGMALGSVGGMVGRGIYKLTGAERNAALKADFDRFITNRADKEHLALFGEKVGRDDLSRAMDLVKLGESEGIKIVFHDNKSIPVDPRLPGDQRYTGVHLKSEGGNPAAIYINVDNVGKNRTDVMPHELFHGVVTETGLRQLRDYLLGERVNGEVIRQGALDEAGFRKFAETYMKGLNEANAASMRSKLNQSFDPSLTAAQRWDAQRGLVDEFGAGYTQAWARGQHPDAFLANRIPSVYRRLFDLARDTASNRIALAAQRRGYDFTGFNDAAGRRMRIPELDKMLKTMFRPHHGGFEPASTPIRFGSNLTEALPVIRAVGAEDLFVVRPDGSVLRQKTNAEVRAENAQKADVLNAHLSKLPETRKTIATEADRGSGTTKGEEIITFDRTAPPTPAQIEAIINSGIYSPSQQTHIRRVLESIGGGNIVEMGYLKATTGGKYGQFAHSTREVLPYKIEINRANVLYFRFADVTKVRARFDVAWKKAEHRGIYGDRVEAWQAFDTYLKNLDSDRPVPSAEALGGGATGERRRNFFYEVLGTNPRKDTVLANQPRENYVPDRKGGSVFESARIERTTSLRPTGEKMTFSEDRGYRRGQVNYLPAFGESERVGDALVRRHEDGFKTIQNAGGKVRLYGKDEQLLGVYATQDEANAVVGKKANVSAERIAPEQDAAYFRAVESGDTAGAQRMVDEAAKAAGFRGPYYHGTKASGWTKYDLSKNSNQWWGEGIYLTLSKRKADLYGFAETKKLFAKWNKSKGDGFEFRGKMAGDVLVKSPEQIKSADPITRDAGGHIIPLSERFNPQSNDIRYMPADGESNTGGSSHAKSRAPTVLKTAVSYGFVPSPKGGDDWGHVSHQMLAESLIPGVLREAPIRIQKGYHLQYGEGFGWVHALDHEWDMKKAGYGDMTQFLSRAIGDFNHIYLQPNGRLMLARENGGKMIVVADLQDNGDFYGITTAYPVKASKKWSEKIRLVWKRRAPAFDAPGRTSSP